MNGELVSRKTSGWSILWGILLILAGTLAICSPALAAVAVTIVLAWMIVFAGCIHLVYAFYAKGVGGIVWQILVSLAYIAVGIYILAHPVRGVASLTLLLASLFLLEGVLDIVAYFQTRQYESSGWLVLDGIVTLLLGGLIGVHWPSSSVWAIGTLVGASMIISGVVRIMMSLAVRRLAAVPA
jgi:uncharacterized membrane protein HdeD (DUF308 family)